MSRPMKGDDLVVMLTGDGADPGLVGGKGLWTDRLIAGGFRVPPTAVLTTAAYEAVVADPGLDALLKKVGSSLTPPAEEHEALRRELDRAFLEVDLPPAVTEALDLAENWIRVPGTDLAARSSATAEDLQGTSFAGQYRSTLELADRSELERGVRLVWASLWHPAPHAYRLFHGVDERDIGMAVMVMRQIDAVHAGVAFTVDPGGRPDSVRVETVVGAGEQLVSGRVTPSVEQVERDHLTGRSERTGAVASLALEVEERLAAGPLDLEWAEDDSGLWLLQARPITGLRHGPDGDGFDTVRWEERRWSRAGIVEMVPGVLPPLRSQVVHLALEEAMRGHEDRLGTLPPEAYERPFFGRIRGQVAMDAELMDLVQAAAVPAGRWGSARRSVRALRERRRALWEAGTCTVAGWEAWNRMPDLCDTDSRELLALRMRMVDLAGRAMAAEVALTSAAVASEERLESQLRRYLEPDEARSWSLRVTSRPGATAAGWPARELAEAFAAASDDALAALAGAEDLQQAADSAATVPGGSDLMEQVEAIVRRAGSSAVLAGPTWEEDPTRWWPAVQRAAADASGNPPASAANNTGRTPLDELLDGLAANPNWLQTRIRTAQVFDLRRLLIQRQAEDAADLLERRERTKAAVLTIGGLIRRVHLELGARLVRAGVLEESGDVELLGEREFRAAVLAESGPVPSPAELSRRRRWLATCEQAGPLPEHFEGSLPSGSTPAARGDLLQGWGAAPGRHRGNVRVLRHAGDGEFNRGDVLVTTSTDASWTPLFTVAGALVVEEGGPLSHAAIVARELGIPAVVNLPGVVSRLSGAALEVTVDGDAGTVELYAADGNDGSQGGLG